MTSDTNIVYTPSMRSLEELKKAYTGRKWYHQKFDGSPLFIFAIADAEQQREDRKPGGIYPEVRVCFFSEGIGDWYLDVADIEKASDLARRMVCDYGMSESLGPLNFGKKEEQVFLGREISQHRDYSEQTAQKIDEEVRNIVTGAHKRATQIIEDNLDTLNRMANALLERETLDTKDIDEIMAGEEGTKCLYRSGS